MQKWHYYDNFSHPHGQNLPAKRCAVSILAGIVFEQKKNKTKNMACFFWNVIEF